ncbi:MAG: DNA-3-methyladenine glycosylase [Candidatus Baltobacteraceae bacterium]
MPADTVALARYLVGTLLVRELQGERLVGRIVETEAYPPGDPAGHAYFGPTPRLRSLYLARGHAYVYTMHGHNLLNVSSERQGVGAGVLIRAAEPLAGIATLERFRPGVPVRDLARGPGKLAKAFAIDRRLNGTDLCMPGALWLAAANDRRRALVISARIGVTRAPDHPLRFCEQGNAHASHQGGLR